MKVEEIQVSRRRPRALSVLRATRCRLVAFDAVIWALALLVATSLRYDFAFTTASVPRLVLVVGSAVVAQAVAGGVFGLYTGRWRSGSFEEAYAIALSVAVVGFVVTTLDLALGRPVPVSACLVSGALAFLGISSVRWVARARRSSRRKQSAPDATRVIVFGAGEGGANIIDAMRFDPKRTYEPVALLDDDPSKAGLRISGVPVRGGREDIETVARTFESDLLVIAIPSADAALITDLSARAEALGLRTQVLPTVSELLDRAVELSDIRPISYVDLLGRHEVEVDLDSIAGYLSGKSILVTGAGGSIGSELCRQISRHAPGALVLLDRDESALHSVVLSIDGRATLDDRRIVVADIRDRDRLAAVFAEHQPDVVFHAAALKHLPLLEMYPDEAVKSNVWGTLNMLEVASEFGVERFVNISTDKAADPVSVLGYSKRVAERLTSWFDAGSATSFMSVRFGNVLGSRGSVLTTFQAQIASGEPLTVTDPDVTRYFMTVEEAVSLVIQAGAFGQNGDALVLDMGEPVRIDDVARRLIKDSGRDCRIVYTGIRPGEKLDEVLLAEGEVDLRPVHPLISHVAVPAMNPVDVLDLPVVPEVATVTAALREASGSALTLPAGRRLALTGERALRVDEDVLVASVPSEDVLYAPEAR